MGIMLHQTEFNNINKHNMTLKDLFMQVRFDDLIPSLLEQDENTQNSICSFRRKRSIVLRMMEPDQDFKGEVVNPMEQDGRG